jgi:serine/threonine protein kinase
LASLGEVEMVGSNPRCLSHEGRPYILKDILPGDFQYNLDLQKLVNGSAHVRTLVDSIHERHIFVYPFLDTNLQLLEIAAITPSVRKSILRDALAGLADLHDKGIYHSGLMSIRWNTCKEI